jgi:O-antigen/teichoic acid export membrane protein
MSFARHTASGIFAFGLPVLTGIVTIPAYLIILGAEKYGVFILLLALLNYAAFFDFGAGRAVTYQIARSRADVKKSSNGIAIEGLLLCLVICLPVTLALLFSREQLALLLPAQPHTNPAEVISAVSISVFTIPLMAFISLLTGVYQGSRSFYRLNAIQAIGGIAVQILPLIICILVESRLDVAMLGVLIARLSLVFFMILLAERTYMQIQALSKLSFLTVKELLFFGRWPTIMSLVGSIISSCDRFFISNLSGAAAVAAYAVPSDLTNKLTIIAGSVANTLFPSLVSDSEDASRKTRAVSRATIALLTPAGVFLVGLLEPFLKLWIGAELAAQGRMIGEIVSLGVWATALGALAQARLLAMNKGAKVVMSYAIQLPIFVITVYFATMYFGIIGTAIVWAIRCHVDALMMQYLTGDGWGVLRDAFPHGALLLVTVILAGSDHSKSLEISIFLITMALSVLLSRQSLVIVVARLWRT